MRFTQEPSDPSLFNNGNDAKLVWDYTDPHNKIQAIIYSVLVNGAFVRMMVNDSSGVQEHPNIPHSYKGRVKLKEELPWLSRTSTLETIPNLTVNSLGAFCTWYEVQCSLLWQVSIKDITINNQIIISNVFNSCLSYY